MIGTLAVVLAILIILAVASTFVNRMFNNSNIKYMDEDWFFKK